MKKILFLILLFFTNSIYVLAEEYYTEYSEYSDYSLESIEPNELVSEDNLIKYKWNITQREEGSYFLEGENPFEYPYINESDYINSSFSEWSLEKPLINLNRTVEEKDLYKYKELEKVRYILVYNPYGSYGSLRIQEAKVFYNGEEIEYYHSCANCNMGLSNTINNEILQENQGYLINGTGFLAFNLGGYYDPELLTLELYLYDVESSVKHFDIAFSNSVNLSNRKASKTYDIYFKCSGLEGYKAEIKLDPSYENDLLYGEWFETNSYIEEKFYRIVEEYKYYRYADKLFKYYNEFIYPFDDNYYEESPCFDCARDEAVIFNRYKTRDKVIINEVIRYRGEKIIPYSSFLEEVIVSGEVNYEENGFYDVEILLPNEEILERTIEVAIEANDMNLEISEISQENEMLKNEKNSLAEEIDFLSETNEELGMEIEGLNDERENVFLKSLDKYKIMIAELNEDLSKKEQELFESEKSNQEYVVLKEGYEKDILSLKNEKNELIDKVKEMSLKLDSKTPDIRIVKEECECEKVEEIVEEEKNINMNYLIFLIPFLGIFTLVIKKVSLK